MEPSRAFTIKPVTLGNKNVPPYTIVWVLKRSGEIVEIEFKEKHGPVPADSIIPYPVKGPGLESLKRLDPCFGLSDEAFIVEHSDSGYLFEILRCKEHGRRFLRDTRGGIAMYTTLTLLLESDDDKPKEIWKKYHYISDSLLRLQGRTL
jgi:hypothetical protein